MTRSAGDQTFLPRSWTSGGPRLYGISSCPERLATQSCLRHHSFNLLSASFLRTSMSDDALTSIDITKEIHQVHATPGPVVFAPLVGRGGRGACIILTYLLYVSLYGGKRNPKTRVSTLDDCSACSNSGQEKRAGSPARVVERNAVVRELLERLLPGIISVCETEYVKAESRLGGSAM